MVDACDGHIDERVSLNTLEGYCMFLGGLKIMNELFDRSGSKRTLLLCFAIEANRLEE